MFDEELWNGSDSSKLKMADADIMGFVATSIPMQETHYTSRS